MQVFVQYIALLWLFFFPQSCLHVQTILRYHSLWQYVPVRSKDKTFRFTRTYV